MHVTLKGTNYEFKFNVILLFACLFISLFRKFLSNEYKIEKCIRLREILVTTLGKYK